jgi:hypothetical protein
MNPTGPLQWLTVTRNGVTKIWSVPEGTAIAIGDTLTIDADGSGAKAWIVVKLEVPAE